jgi:hypothetical protein
MRSIGVPIALLLVALLSSACHETQDSGLNPSETTVFGVWEATVSEVQDTCDGLRPADLKMSVDIEPFDVRHMVRFRDYGAGLNCWIQVFEVDEDVLSWSIAYDTDLDCNPGCRIRLQSQVDFVVQPGGVFSGLETVSYEPLTPECDVPACASPCANPIDHMVWESWAGRGCGFSCMTTYQWEALLEPDVLPAACD